MSIEGLQRLNVWKESKDFAVRIYKEVLPQLPIEEKWGLSYQIRRSAQSIPANIAEGYGRYYYQDNVRFCYIARGSLEELLSHLVLAHDLGYLQNELFEGLAQQGKSLARLINGYISYLKGSIQGANEPGFDWGLHEPLDEYLTSSTDDIDDSQFSTLDSQGDIE